MQAQTQTLAANKKLSDTRSQLVDANSLWRNKQKAGATLNEALQANDAQHTTLIATQEELQDELAKKEGETKVLMQRLTDHAAKRTHLEAQLMKCHVDNAKLHKEMVNLKQRCDTLLTDKVAAQTALSRLHSSNERKDKELILAKNRLLQERESTRIAKIASDQSRRAEMAANQKFRDLSTQLADSETQREFAYSSASQAIASETQRKWELEATQQVRAC